MSRMPIRQCAGDLDFVTEWPTGNKKTIVAGLTEETDGRTVDDLAQMRDDRQNAPIECDLLILATGVTHSYFGDNEIRAICPGSEESGRRSRDPESDLTSI